MMRSGTPVFDQGGPLHDGVKSLVASHPCVERVRPLVLAPVSAQTKSSTPLGVFVIGVELGTGPRAIPWQTLAGLPNDLRPPLRVSVDRADLERLHLPDEPVGAQLNLAGLSGRVAVVTERVKNFTLSPLMFATTESARAMVNLTDGQSNFWIADLRDKACAGSLIQKIKTHRELDARTTADFVAQSEKYWMGKSGAGPILQFGMILSLFIAGAVVAQALYALTRDHARELAALKALGSTSGELARFVLWQAFALGSLGSTLGVAFAFAVQSLGVAQGANVVLSGVELQHGFVSIFAVCLGASALAIRSVLKIPPTAVFE